MCPGREGIHADCPYRILRDERDRNFDTSKHRWDAVNCPWDEEFKLVPGTENEDELFDLTDETGNVIENFPEVMSELRQHPKSYLPRLPETDERDPADFSDDAHERLRDMGYIQQDARTRIDAVPDGQPFTGGFSPGPTSLLG